MVFSHALKVKAFMRTLFLLIAVKNVAIYLLCYLCLIQCQRLKPLTLNGDVPIQKISSMNIYRFIRIFLYILLS